MIKKTENLYKYRVFTKGGHIHVCCVPFDTYEDFWEEIQKKKDNLPKSRTIEACYLAANGAVIYVCIDAFDIVAIDSVFDDGSSFTLKDQLAKFENANKQHLTRKQNKTKVVRSGAGQSVSKRSKT